MNNGHHGALYDQVGTDWLHQRGLVLVTVWRVFVDAFGVLGGLRPTLSVSLYSIFIVVFLLLNGVPRVSTCPISPSHQLLGVVVKIEEYGRVRHRALNAIMAAFPLNTLVVLFCFSTFPAPWDDRECHYRWQVTSSILGYTVPRKCAEEGSPRGRGRAFPPRDREGIFPLGWAFSLI